VWRRGRKWQIDQYASTRVEGLYASCRGQTLASDIVASVFRRSPADFRSQHAALGNGPELRLDDVFGCKFLYDDKKPGLTLWLIWFFNELHYTVETYPTEADRLEWEARFGPRGPR
jgi:hypothetical protein